MDQLIGRAALPGMFLLMLIFTIIGIRWAFEKEKPPQPTSETDPLADPTFNPGSAQRPPDRSSRSERQVFRTPREP